MLDQGIPVSLCLLICKHLVPVRDHLAGTGIGHDLVDFSERSLEIAVSRPGLSRHADDLQSGAKSRTQPAQGVRESFDGFSQPRYGGKGLEQGLARGGG